MYINVFLVDSLPNTWHAYSAHALYEYDVSF
jgi:hypothetical protein